MEISVGSLADKDSGIIDSANLTVLSINSKSILKKKSYFRTISETNNIPLRDKETEVNFRNNLEDVVEVESFKKFNQALVNEDESSKCCALF